MGIADQSGFEAIQPTIPQGPYARRKIVRGPDGTPQVILVDQSGQTISDPSGYNIIDSSNYLDPSSLATTVLGTSNPKPSSEESISGSTAKKIIRDTSRGEKESTGLGSGSYGRDQSNNFGYVNKPAGMGLVGMVPGPIGLAGKAVNVGINAN